jgi:hypothetical protein
VRRTCQHPATCPGDPSGPHWRRIAVRQHTCLRGYTCDFIEMFAPHLTRSVDDVLRAKRERPAHPKPAHDRPEKNA